ncbi:MAG: alkaline phosphatase family protein [bacterium]|nr:alkaline phosphatase family protein [bacterium]
MAAPLLVIGLDGAGLDLVEPWAAEGRLPALRALLARGAFGPLRSTIPAATFPAWTSLLTGVNPGRHGVLDFLERVPGTYRMRFVNGSHRRVPALWNRLSAAGRRCAVLTVPATYPPEPIDGIMVSGWDTPLTTRIDASFVHPPAFHDEVRRLVGTLPFADFQEVRTGAGWHARALASLLDGVDRRTRLAEALLARGDLDALVVVYGESDTVSHHFWRFHDAASPRHAASPHGDAIRRVYAALDAAVGRLVAAAGPDAVVAVVSDHGSGGASDRVLHLNRRLAECGLLAFRTAGGGAARLARRLALRAIPTGLQGAILRRAPETAGRLEGMARLGQIAWPGTQAYSEELDYHPSVWINRADRDPEGVVAPADYERVRAQVVAALLDWRDAAGAPVVARVWRREEIYDGPATERAPDLLLEPAWHRGYRPSCLRSAGPGPALRRLSPAEYGAGKDAGTSGTHRREGLFALAGPGVNGRGRLAAADVVDVLPTLLPLVGLPVPGGLDGRPIRAALAVAAREEADRVPAPASTPLVFGPEETRILTERLAALGYLEPGS